jgi:hypothetical protein
VPHAGQDRQAEDGHHRQRAGGRFEDAPDDDAPGAAAQVMHHQQRQAAEADAGPVDPGHQIRFVEAIGARHREADAGEHGADDGGNHALRLEARETRGRGVGFRSHV